MHPSTRVFVTTYEKPALLRLAFRGWLRQSTTAFAMTIADDGSGEETREVVRAFAATAPFRVDHVWQRNEGFRKAAAMNEAVRRCAGEALLVFTDGDCVPPPTFVERHQAAHGPRSFAVAGCYRLRREVTERLTAADVDAGRVEALVTPRKRMKLARRRRFTRLATWFRRPGHPLVLGLNVAVDRTLFEEVNGYDEAFVGYGHEDDDLRDRLMAARPRATLRLLWGLNDVVHLWHPRVASWAERPSEMPNAAYYATKRPTRCVRGLVAPPAAAPTRTA